MNKSNDEFAALVGLDWADKKHLLSLQICGEQSIERSSLDQTPEAIAAWVSRLRERFGSGRIGICLEQSRGALINSLSCHENLVLFPVNPKSMARFRTVFAPSGAKDDPTDADFELELVRKHRDRLTRWEPDTEQTRQLTLLNEGRRGLVDLRTQLTNQLQSVLKGYFPQALVLIGPVLSNALATDFLKKWPTLADIQGAQTQEIRTFYYGHNSRSEKLMQERLVLIKQTVALTTDPAIVQSQALLAVALAELLAKLRAQIQKFDQQIKPLFESHPDQGIFASFPGAGPVMAPRLLAGFGSRRERFPAATNLQCFSGIAPVTEKSGQSKWVHFRWACPKFLRQSFHEFANHSRKRCAWARCYYQHLLAQGKDHQAALRALAYKWQRILWRCWRDHTPYDDARHVQRLLQKCPDIYRSLRPKNDAAPLAATHP